ncbi:hypothetical protein ACVC7V_26590 [Hydrogenophaga sp. A37]|uniref:hypothetical protein n=1 Tax=Hydrogenophaga sp. A37 TaxID=1945864 RepID=UPI0009864464|nr:hypothetical protein [Hydrogenophaga sp. A37]OOG87613.1 hypothetical protein B0E41_03560 [Hydrogenophaga sp. A37]
MSSQVFRKTESGKAEIARRQAGLSAATRTVLILVNGSDTVSALMARGLPQLQGHLDTLLALGLIEPVAPPPAPVSASMAAQAASASPNLDALRRQAMAYLGNHFGPDTPQVAQALLGARSVAEFNAALDGIESKLAIYLGRKQAARELLALRPAT